MINKMSRMSRMSRMNFKRVEQIKMKIMLYNEEIYNI